MIVDENILIKYLDGTLTDEERTQVDDWVTKSTENEKLLEQVYFTLQVTDRLRVMESVDPEMALVRFKSRVRKQNKKVPSRYFISMFSSTIIFFPVSIINTIQKKDILNENVIFLEKVQYLFLLLDCSVHHHIFRLSRFC